MPTKKKGGKLTINRAGYRSVAKKTTKRKKKKKR